MLQRTRALMAVLLVVAVIATGGCTGLSSSGKEEPTPTPLPPPEVAERPTYTVQRGDVVDTVTFNGRVSPTIEEELYFRANGRVLNVLVKRNDLVEEGQLLAELDNADLLRQLAQAQIELNTAQSNLDSALKSVDTQAAAAEGKLDIQRLQLQKLQGSLGALNLDVQLARARLDAAQAGSTAEQLAIALSSLEQAKSSLWAAQSARDAACGNPGVQCNSAEANVQRAEQQVSMAELNLQTVQAGPTAVDILSLRSAYERALQNRRSADIDIAVLQKQIELAEAELALMAGEADPQVTAAVERTTLAVERLEAQLADTRIVAPFAGRLTTSSVTEGTDAQAFKTVMVVSDETKLEITAEPIAAQLDKMSEGMVANLVLSQYPGQLLTGVIYQLPYPYGGGGGTALEDVDKKTRISFEPGDLDLQPGDLVKVDVTVAQAVDALWLPPAAIRTFSGRSFVVIQDGASERRVDVSLGIQGLDRVEILEGLEQGQVVVGQ
ncbi:MAG: efflux RND transporter periplasmic adaptor subunit [Anaerolineae bacterium]